MSNLIWGPHEPYDRACAVLLANLSNLLPQPHFWMLEENDQKIAAAVTDYTAMTLDRWDRLSPPERVVWVNKANESLLKQRSADATPTPAPTAPESTAVRMSLESRALAVFFENPSLTKKQIAERIGSHEKSLAPRRCPKLAAAMAAHKAPEIGRSVRRGSKVDGRIEAEDE